MAIKQAKIFSRPRVSLEEVLPLKTPFSVEIDICSACNLNCTFCFHADKPGIKQSGITFGLMEMGVFEKIVNDLKGFPDKIKKVRLFEFGEPLLHPRLADMIQLLKGSGVTEYVETTTNGLLLTPELGGRLVEAGLDRMNISVNGITKEQYLKMTGHSLDMEDFLNNVRHFYEHKKQCHVYIKLSDDGTLTKEDETEFYRLFEGVCDEIFVERLSPIWRDTEVNSSLEGQLGPYGQELTYKKVCPLIFTRYIINHDGIAVACCVDWKRQYIIGDLKIQNACDVWNGEPMRSLQLTHLEGARETVPMCNGCTALMSCTIDNLDAGARKVYERMHHN